MKMHRTQLYITQEQHDWLKRKARQEDTTMAKISRKAIDSLIQSESNTKNSQNQKNVFIEIAELAKKRGYKGPKDLASNVDKYLYSDI